ncbi:MAG: ATP-binding cassette domain-containing protein [Pseudomonadota bacterium]
MRSPSGRIILEVEDLKVAPGEILAIRGPSGAGKSTLLLAIAGIIHAAQGQISWGEVDLTGANEAERTGFRDRILGIVFQDHLLFEELSAVGNAGLSALFAPREERKVRRRRAAEALSSFGIDPEDRRNADTYSGGERQRISIARALASDPPVLLADEPTASLDRTNANSLVGDMFRHARENQRTMIAVSHDPALIDAADRVVTITDGRLLNG